MENVTQNQYYIKELTREEAVSTYRDNGPLHFPDDELKPVSTIELLYDMNAYLGLGLYRNANTLETTAQESKTEARSPQENLLGYALFLTPPGQDTVLLDYYAILEDYRDLGLGSFFLQGMKSHFTDKTGILIETEDPVFAPNEEEALLRHRRNAFYYKNGVQPTNVYCTLFGVPFQIQFMPTGSEYATGAQPATAVPQTIKATTVQSVTPAPQRHAPGALDVFVHTNLEATYRFMLPESVYERNVVWR